MLYEGWGRGWWDSLQIVLNFKSSSSYLAGLLENHVTPMFCRIVTWTFHLFLKWMWWRAAVAQWLRLRGAAGSSLDRFSKGVCGQIISNFFMRVHSLLWTLQKWSSWRKTHGLLAPDVGNITQTLLSLVPVNYRALESRFDICMSTHGRKSSTLKIHSNYKDYIKK